MLSPLSSELLLCCNNRLDTLLLLATETMEVAEEKEEARGSTEEVEAGTTAPGRAGVWYRAMGKAQQLVDFCCSHISSA